MRADLGGNCLISLVRLLASGSWVDALASGCFGGAIAAFFLGCFSFVFVSGVCAMSPAEDSSGLNSNSAVISSSSVASEFRMSKISFASGGVASATSCEVPFADVFGGDWVSGIVVGSEGSLSV